MGETRVMPFICTQVTQLRDYDFPHHYHDDVIWKRFLHY